MKDGGGAPGEAPVALAIARRTKQELEARGLRVVMTRRGDGYRGGNRERAAFCNARGAALMIRIHADGSSDPSRRGVSTLVPARRRGWTDDIYADSRRAGELVQRELVRSTGATDLGIVERSDLTGFNWADVPARARRDRLPDEPPRARSPSLARLPAPHRPWSRRSRSALRDPVDHPAAPVADQEPHRPSARPRGRADARSPSPASPCGRCATSTRTSFAPPPLAQVLAPLGDDEAAAPEGEAVRGRVRLEVRHRRRHARAARRRAAAAASSPSSPASRSRRRGGRARSSPPARSSPRSSRPLSET